MSETLRIAPMSISLKRRRSDCGRPGEEITASEREGMQGKLGVKMQYGNAMMARETEELQIAETVVTKSIVRRGDYCDLFCLKQRILALLISPVSCP